MEEKGEKYCWKLFCLFFVWVGWGGILFLDTFLFLFWGLFVFTCNFPFPRSVFPSHPSLPPPPPAPSCPPTPPLTFVHCQTTKHFSMIHNGQVFYFFIFVLEQCYCCSSAWIQTENPEITQWELFFCFLLLFFFLLLLLLLLLLLFFLQIAEHSGPVKLVHIRSHAAIWCKVCPFPESMYAVDKITGMV